jgi:DNA-binding Xre family transcriptional regulator
VLVSTVSLKVRQLAEQRGIENPFSLSRLTGLGYAICHRMWNGETSLIALETIAKLCDGLKVKPGQLFEYEAE